MTRLAQPVAGQALHRLAPAKAESRATASWRSAGSGPAGGGVSSEAPAALAGVEPLAGPRAGPSVADTLRRLAALPRRPAVWLMH